MKKLYARRVIIDAMCRHGLYGRGLLNDEKTVQVAVACQECGKPVFVHIEGNDEKRKTCGRKRIDGIVFGNGESIDRLPDRVFELAGWKETGVWTCGTNRAPVCARFQACGWKPDKYAAFDPYRRGGALSEAFVAGLKRWLADGWEGEMFFGDRSWPLEKYTVPEYRPWTNSGEWGCKILKQRRECKNILVFGCEGYGKHHKINVDVEDDGDIWTRAEAQYAARCGWAKMARDYKVELYAWPEDSQIAVHGIAQAMSMGEILESLEEAKGAWALSR